MTDPTMVKWLVFCALGAGVMLTALVLLLTGRKASNTAMLHRQIRAGRRNDAVRLRTAAKLRRQRRDTGEIVEELNDAFPPEK